MKLWCIAQWGNPKEGGNGDDTQCIVSAPDLQTAIQFGQTQISYRNNDYRDGKADTIFLMGDDGRPDGEPQLVVRVWIAFIDNPMHYKAWHRHPQTDEWLDTATMYGEDCAKDEK